MSSVKVPRPLIAALGGVAILILSAGPAAAETLVVRASGPSAGTFAPGRKLADGASVTLKAGDVLTLLDGRGTRTLRGPGVFRASSTATGGGATSIAGFIGSRNTLRARTGAVRGEAVVRSPNLWYVDISKPATICVADPAVLKLWRPAPSEAATLAITGKGGKGSVSFEEGQAVTIWPATLPVSEGASYQLSGGDLAKPVSITFTLLGPGADGLENTASTLIARKCTVQLDLLVETVALPDPLPDTPG